MIIYIDVLFRWLFMDDYLWMIIYGWLFMDDYL